MVNVQENPLDSSLLNWLLNWCCADDDELVYISDTLENIKDGYLTLDDYEKNPDGFDKEEIELLKIDIETWEESIADIKDSFLSAHKKADWEKELENVVLYVKENICMEGECLKMNEYVFEAYVTNLGKYTEGDMIGEWVKFPTTSENMQKVLDRIGINEHYQEVFITDYSSKVYGLSSELGEYERLEKLNYLAGAIQDLTADDREKYEAILQGGLSLNEEGIDGLINLTYNLDNYDLLSDVKDDYDLGKYYVELSYGEDLEEKFGELGNYIDFDAYGRDIHINDNGMYTDVGYITCNGDGWVHYYDGSLEDIPDEYALNTGCEESMHNQFSKAIEEAIASAEVVEPDASMEI